MSQVDLHMSAPQARRLLNGEGIVLKPHQIGEGGKRFHLPIHIVKKLHSAKRRSKGLRLALSHEDREVNGGSIASFFRSKVLPVYQSKIAPVVRQGLKDVANAAAGALGESLGGPGGAMLAAQASPYINQGIDYVGNTTGGFGLRRRVHATHHSLTHRGVSHSARHPVLANLPDFSMPNVEFSGVSARELAPPRTVGRRVVRGGSFLPA